MYLPRALPRPRRTRKSCGHMRDVVIVSLLAFPQKRLSPKLGIPISLPSLSRPARVWSPIPMGTTSVQTLSIHWERTPLLVSPSPSRRENPPSDRAASLCGGSRAASFRVLNGLGCLGKTIYSSLGDQSLSYVPLLGGLPSLGGVPTSTCRSTHTARFGLPLVNGSNPNIPTYLVRA